MPHDKALEPGILEDDPASDVGLIGKGVAVIDLSSEECWAVLERGRTAHLGVVSEGEAYVTPMSYVIRADEIVFRTAPGRRVDSLEENTRVCIEVTVDRDDTGWESVILWGAARFIDDETVHGEVVADLLAKYHTESLFSSAAPQVAPAERSVVAIRPDQITGRSSGGGLGTNTRPGRL
jgi:nitroimidazol reductase NimA-like FMN-containing flavoprotein (pyridoxamine 5'-phosphate oxidase superfamily)